MFFLCALSPALVSRARKNFRPRWRAIFSQTLSSSGIENSRVGLADQQAVEIQRANEIRNHFVPCCYNTAWLPQHCCLDTGGDVHVVSSQSSTLRQLVAARCEGRPMCVSNHISCDAGYSPMTGLRFGGRGYSIVSVDHANQFRKTTCQGKSLFEAGHAFGIPARSASK